MNKTAIQNPSVHFFSNIRGRTMSGLLLLCICVLMVLYLGCFRNSRNKQDEEVNVALDWNKFILKAEINTEGYRGPVAARAYGYIGLAAYEAGLPGFNGNFQSLAYLYHGLQLPSPPPASKFNISASLNACYSTLIGRLFMSAPDPIMNYEKQLMEKWDGRISRETDDESFRLSKEFGSAVAYAIFEWSSTDSLGYESNHHNYDRSYKVPVGDGKWSPSPLFPMPALLPYWGKVRPFIINTADYLAKPLPEYSAEPNQFYHQQALEILSLSKPLSAENQWIAEFWNDDHPGLTFTPAGHWLAIANQVIEKEHPAIEKTLETYLKTGFALSDAMIACWASKYYFNLERPETFIQKYLDKDWRSFTPSPSFPSYPSGHAMLGGAAAAVLTQLYGEYYVMTDRSHDELKDIIIKPRTFHSFEETAKESGLSRIFAGVHFRFDVEEGLRLGGLIGQQVSQLDLQKKLDK